MKGVLVFRLALWLPVMVLVLPSINGCALGCESSSPRGPATVSSGPVTIGLDHSVYAPDDTITITVVNQSQMTVDISRGIPGNCLPYYIVPQNGTTLGAAEQQDCYPSEANPGFRREPLGPGISTQFILDQETRDTLHVVLQPGAYVVDIPYATVDTRDRPISGGDATSQSFRICTCATCS
jgi:hypothetical protein